MAEARQIGSIDKVMGELYRNEDDLKTWCEQNLPNDFFQDSTAAIEDYAQIVSWAYSKRNSPYTESALDVFMQADEADAFLAAFAKTHRLILVTNEVSAPESKRSIKLPDVCNAFGIPVVSPVQMFRALGITI